MMFGKLAAAARLAHKYEFSEVLRQATVHIRSLFPSKFQDWVDNEIKRAETLLPHDAIEAIILFRSLSLNAMLPPAFYLASQLHASTILEGTSRVDGVSVMLAPEDIARCLELKGVCIKASATAHEAVFGADTGKLCTRLFGSCSKALSAAGARCRSEALNGDPLGDVLGEFLEKAVADRSVKICDACRDKCEEIERDEREKFWSRLPRIVRDQQV